MTKLYYKTQRIQDEVESGQVNNKLIDILQVIAKWIRVVYPDYHHITITDCFRTQEEQDAIYGNKPKYKDKPWKSVHQYWRGLDIRVNDMPDGMAQELTNMLNTIPYDRSRPNKKTAILHDVGTGNHIHLQVK